MATEAPSQVEATKLELYVAARPRLNILKLFDRLEWFKTGADWSAWRACLCAIYGLPMTAAELEIYRQCTGRVNPPTRKAREVWLVCGRRARKSAIAALLGIWEGSADYSPFLAPGERPWIPVLAKNRDDAQQIKRFADNILDNMAWLRDVSKADEIRLHTSVDMVIRAAKITAGRSRACPLALLDEIAFFPTDEAAQPDAEIIRGIRPGMATIPGAMLVGLSSPYARRGVLWESYRDHFGKDDDPVLVWQADTLTMHNTPQIVAEVAAEYEKDPQNAAAEYGALFRTDVEAFVTDEIIDDITMHGVEEIPPGHEQEPPLSHNYFAFVDPAGGTADSMTWAICHYDLFERKVIHDLSKEVPAPFDAGDAMLEMAEDLKRYRITQVKGDRWGGMWNRAPLRSLGISYYASERAKSDIYRDVLPLLTSKRVKLLDIPRIRLQFTGLDRRSGRGGRDSIDHLPGGHDDLCLAGGTLVATTRGPVSIEEVAPGDYALTPSGPAKVLWAGKTGHAPVAAYGKLLCTHSHPIFCEGSGFVAAVKATGGTCDYLTLSSLIRWSVLQSCTSTGSSTDSWGPESITSASQLSQRKGGARRVFTSLFGRLLAERQFRRATRLITRITTLSTTALTTWSAYRRRCIAASLRTSIVRRFELISDELTTWARASGMLLRQASSGIARTLSSAASASDGTRALAYAVANPGKNRTPRLNTVHRSALSGQESGSYSRSSVTNAATPSPQRWPEGLSAPGNALGEQAQGSVSRDVYNLRVEGAECFYADGVLVHNCNSLAGAILEADERGRGRMPPEIEEPPAKTFDEIMIRERRDALRKAESGESGYKRRASHYRRGRH